MDPEKEQKDFNRQLGVPGKLKKLRKHFGIEPKYSESISQLYATRNCLTHDLGVVTKRRCNGSSELVLTWRGMDLVAIGNESGKMQVYPDFMGQPAEEDATIALRFVDRERRFPIDQKIRLSQQDLAEICHFFASMIIPTTIESFVTFLKANGIQVSGEAGVGETAVSSR